MGNPILDEMRETCISDEMLEEIKEERLERAREKIRPRGYSPSSIDVLVENIAKKLKEEKLDPQEQLCKAMASISNQALLAMPCEEVFVCLAWFGFDIMLQIAGDTQELRDKAREGIAEFYKMFVKEIDKIKGKKRVDVFPSTGKPAIVIQRSV